MKMSSVFLKVVAAALISTQAQAIFVIPKEVFKPVLDDFQSINKSAVYQCDGEAEVILAKSTPSPKVGAIVYAYGYREYGKRISSVKDGHWQVSRVIDRGITMVRKYENGKAVGKEYDLSRFGHLDKVKGKSNISGKCYEIGKSLILNYDGKEYGKIVAIGGTSIAIQEPNGKVVIEQSWLFRPNCR
jgi:hypothetical protein